MTALSKILHKCALREELDMLKNYLTMSPADQGRELVFGNPEVFVQWAESQDPEVFVQWAESQEIELPEDAVERIEKMGDLSGIDDKLLEQFLIKEGNTLLESGDPYVPSFLFYDYRGEFQGGQLVHFTDDADSIVRKGFTFGAPDIFALGLTTNFSESYRKRESGYNFAFEPRYARSGDHYGKEAVSFQVDEGVKVYHYGDEERQVIFWGGSARDLVAVRYDRSEHEWYIYDEKNDSVLISDPDIRNVLASEYA